MCIAILTEYASSFYILTRKKENVYLVRGENALLVEARYINMYIDTYTMLYLHLKFDN